MHRGTGLAKGHASGSHRPGRRRWLLSSMLSLALLPALIMLSFTLHLTAILPHSRAPSTSVTLATDPAQSSSPQAYQFFTLSDWTVFRSLLQSPNRFNSSSAFERVAMPPGSSDPELYFVPNPADLKAPPLLMGRGAFGNGTVRGQPQKNRTRLISTLSTMFDVDLAPHFIRHYLGLGIQPSDFLILLHAPNNNSPEIRARLIYYETMLNIFRVKPVKVWFGDFRTDVKWRNMLEVLYNHTWIGDWIVHADSDEFHEYPEWNVTKFLETAEASGFTAVKGRLFDRLPRDCRMRSAVETIDIYDQYPCKVDLTVQVMKARKGVKVMAYKGGHRLTSGGGKTASLQLLKNGKVRHLIHTQPPEAKYFDKYLPVDHLKWREGVVEKLRERAERYKNLGFSWWKESKRFLDFYDKNNGVLKVQGCPC